MGQRLSRQWAATRARTDHLSASVVDRLPLLAAQRELVAVPGLGEVLWPPPRAHPGYPPAGRVAQSYAANSLRRRVDRAPGLRVCRAGPGAPCGVHRRKFEDHQLLERDVAFDGVRLSPARKRWRPPCLSVTAGPRG